MDINDNNYQVIFTKQSEREMKSIYWYISKTLYSKVSALQIMKDINSKIMHLSTFPRLYCELKIPNPKGIKYHRLVVKKYIVIYIVNEKKKTVYIIHIFHSKSNYQKRLYSKSF